MLSGLSIRDFSKALASEAPYPGGGSASCLAGALGIGLALMVGRIASKRKPGARLGNVLSRLAKIHEKALRGIDGDVRAYRKVVAAYALKKTAKGRKEKIEKALRAAYAYQKDFARELVAARGLSRTVAGIAGGSIASDIILSGHFLRAAFEGSLQTARVNLEYMRDKNFQRDGYRTLERLARAFARSEK